MPWTKGVYAYAVCIYIYIHYNPCFVIYKCVYMHVHIHTYMGVSKNRGTPKWMVYNGKPQFKWMIWWYPYFWKHPYIHINIITGPWCFGLRKRTFGLHDAATAKVTPSKGMLLLIFTHETADHLFTILWCCVFLLAFAEFAKKCCLLPWIVPHVWGIGFAFWSDFKQKEVLRKETVSIGPHQKRGHFRMMQETVTRGT